MCAFFNIRTNDSLTVRTFYRSCCLANGDDSFAVNLTLWKNVLCAFVDACSVRTNAVRRVRVIKFASVEQKLVRFKCERCHWIFELSCSNLQM